MDQEFNVESYWPYKRSFGVGLFTDMNLYAEALSLAKSHGYINISMLERNLSERIRGLKYIEAFKKRTFQDLIRELTRFGYIYKKDSDYYLTQDGLSLISLYKSSVSNYHDAILLRMNNQYVIPSWFVNRLWEINPSGQGQVVIPSPLKNWKPEKRKWQDNKWNQELEQITTDTYWQINKKLPSSFPIDLATWKADVKKEYERLGNRVQRMISKKTQENEGKRMEFFAPRGRLTLAMKNVSVLKLFGNEFNGKKDFIGTPVIIDPRNFMVWCPRLESFELIYYSDYFEEVPGRLIFPCSVFRKTNKSSNFIKIDSIQSPNKFFLYRHKPQYTEFKNNFLDTLIEVYENRYNKEGIIYVSIQQVRDEVCRLIRISAQTFEVFLQQAFRDSVSRKINYSIALETDIREDQKSGFQVQRRPVYIGNTPHSLIAIKQYQ